MIAVKNPLHEINKEENIDFYNDNKGSLLAVFTETWSSVVVVGMIVFVGDSSRGILFPVLFSLCESLGGTASDMGYLVGIFSLGRLLVTTPLGYYCDIYGHMQSLLIANATLFIGSILWANAYGTKNLSTLYLAQFIMGCGSGSLGVTRSYIVEQVPVNERTNMLAIMTALQYAGFTISPIVGALLRYTGRSSSSSTGSYWEFALPAYFISLMSLYCILGLINFFRDIPRLPSTSPSQGRASIQTSSSSSTSTSTEPAFLCTMVWMILLNVTTKGSIAVYETLGAQTATVDYLFSPTSLVSPHCCTFYFLLHCSSSSSGSN